MMQWHIVTSAEYKAGTKVAENLYFLSDTKQIYRGEDLYTESVTLYTTLPETPATGRLYIDAASLEGKVYNGTEWKTVISPITVDQTVTANSEHAVSSKAVIAYLAAELAKRPGADNTVSAVTWDSAEHILTTEMADSSTTDIQLTGLGVSLSYVAATGKLQLLDATGAKIGQEIELAKDQFVTSGEYDPATKTITLYFDAEKTKSVAIDASGLVDIYTGEDTQSISTVVTSDNKVKATIKISTAEGNIITLKEDGIYVAAPTVDLSGKMDKVENATEGAIAILDANGQVVAGDTTLAELKAATGKVDIATSENIAATVDAASDEKVVSEKALVSALTWHTTM